MSVLKHILIMIALTVAAMPCCHADGHDLHAHDAETGADICASHTCACHSCDETACSEELDIPQVLTASAASAAIPSYRVRLFIFTERKPVARQIPPPAGGVLATLQTVQLLI